jgi:RNA polymerase sigma factor (sigma-70 family)
MSLPPFQAVLERYKHDVYRFLAALVGPQAAEDCFQETFLAALRAYPRLRPDSNVRAWLLTIANRKALDYFRRTARAAIPVEQVPEVGVLDRRPDDSVWQMVAELPTKQRAAVVYRFVNDLPYADIASALGTSVEAARRNVHEGIKKLREVLVT